MTAISGKYFQLIEGEW